MLALWLTGYAVGFVLGALAAARGMTRCEVREGWDHDTWDGPEWVFLLFMAAAWPMSIPISLCIGRSFDWGEKTWLQRVLTGRG